MKSRPKRFILCFESHRKDGRVWAIKTGGKWITARFVALQVPTLMTRYRPNARTQPKAMLCGVGLVKRGVAGSVWISR